LYLSAYKSKEVVCCLYFTSFDADLSSFIVYIIIIIIITVAAAADF
jgi:hypothetical protein